MSEVLSLQQQSKSRDEMLVHGYIKKSNLINNDFPVDIINLCIRFYHTESDRFDPEKVGEYHALNGNILTHTGTVGSRFNTASTSLLSNTIINGSHEWKFKINKYAGSMVIGIWRIKDNESVRSTKFTDFNGGYGYQCGNRLKLPGCANYGISAKTNDIVTMHLNMDTSTLRYFVNDQDQGIAFDNIDKTEYKAAVYLFGDDTVVELIEYNKL